MNADSNSITQYRLAGMLLVCWAVPPALCYYLGSAVGALGALGVAAFWYSQFRLPAWKERSNPSFWFVVGGYGLIGITLIGCLGRFIGTSR